MRAVVPMLLSYMSSNWERQLHPTIVPRSLSDETFKMGLSRCDRSLCDQPRYNHACLQKWYRWDLKKKQTQNDLLLERSLPMTSLTMYDQSHYD